MDPSSPPYRYTWHHLPTGKRGESSTAGYAKMLERYAADPFRDPSLADPDVKPIRTWADFLAYIEECNADQPETWHYAPIAESAS